VCVQGATVLLQPNKNDYVGNSSFGQRPLRRLDGECSHISENLTNHVSLQQKMLVELQIENQELRKSLAANQHMLEVVTHTGTLPFQFTMTEFERHKRDNDRWFSPPFYTHTHGYRMCVEVNANGFDYHEGKNN